ncbi:hypothetical protein B0H13DRAFT_2578808 [Mycena leptocephala]|nr:hypothetical protein B0H13DRAFT_2578808 [Mycena leptocephala]
MPPFIHDAAKDYGAGLSTRKLFSAYLLCMKGDANMEDADGAELDEDDDMDIDDLFTEDAGGTPRPDSSLVSDDSEDSDFDPAAGSPTPSTGRYGSSTSERSVSRQKSLSPRISVQSSSRATPPRLATPPESIHKPSPPPAERDPAAEAVAMTWRPVIPAGDEDAALIAVSNLVTSHKEQKLALEARALHERLQDEINALKTGREDFDVLKASRDNLDTQVEVLKINCATHVGGSRRWGVLVRRRTCDREVGG